MNLKNIKLNKRSQTQKNKYHIIQYTWHFRETSLIYSEISHTNSCRKRMSSQDRWEGLQGEFWYHWNILYLIVLAARVYPVMANLLALSMITNSPLQHMCHGLTTTEHIYQTTYKMYKFYYINYVFASKND